MLEQAMEVAADKGRGGDNMVAHLTRGEVVIPKQLLERDPKLRDSLSQVFKANGGSMDEFTVGHESNKINPETKQPEFFWWVPLVVAGATLYSAETARRDAKRARQQAASDAAAAREQAAAQAQQARDAAAAQAQAAREQQQAMLDQQKSDAAARLEQTRMSAEQQKKMMENLTAQQAQAAEAARAQLAQQQAQYGEQKAAAEKAAADQAKALEEERRKTAQRESAQMAARRRSGRRALLSEARLTPETGLAPIEDGGIRMTTRLGG
jgi:hypothetical protein